MNINNRFKTLVLALVIGTGIGMFDGTAHGQVPSRFTLTTATLAGGCFWCLEPPYEGREGIVDVIAGYTGGNTLNPTYREIGTGLTGHYEAVQVTFDPRKISYEEILRIFWQNIDPTDAGGQFADRGSQYKTAIFYHDAQQLKIAQKSRSDLASSGKFQKSIATELIPASQFFPAEEYHQDYYKKNATHYNRYKKGSGRAGYIERTWGKD
jgi:methionine-S-sulfoxide reductase